MIIKSVTAKGDAVPYTPREALVYAVRLGLSSLNDTTQVFWSHDPSPTATTFDVQQLEDTNYEAKATGTTLVGRTTLPNDVFCMPKLYEFDIHYKSSKDPIGAPHLSIISFQAKPTSTNPADNVGLVPVSAPSEPLSLGEIVPTSGGKARGKK